MSPQLRQIWKNEYFKTVLALVLIVLVVLGFFQGLKWVLRTDYPVLAVVSTSMVPTLNVGDLLIVQGTAAKDINASYGTGDIVIFKRDESNPDFRVVHRAVKKELRTDGYWITTHGDNNPSADQSFNEKQLIGKVVARVPYLGNLSLFTQSQGSVYLFFMIAVVLIIILLIFWNTGSENEKGGEEPKKKKKLFGKLSYEAVIFTVINVLLICFIIFNLWGAFTFWQPGAAEGSQNVTIRGMYTDLQYHFNDPNIKRPYNNISEASLLQGFFTYKIDSIANGVPRSGVLTFSWFQFSILLLVVFDVWELIGLSKVKRAAKTSKLELSQACSPD
ncbi:signal peptidase I [Candidatus Bathyarchaeota archaeon RBG_13_46_16b]|nr:MAG: signal peptidase I [Candidatus Bathyarchaeota archaeon RBG_13_46_16b]